MNLGPVLFHVLKWVTQFCILYWSKGAISCTVVLCQFISCTELRGQFHVYHVLKWGTQFCILRWSEGSVLYPLLKWWAICVSCTTFGASSKSCNEMRGQLFIMHWGEGPSSGSCAEVMGQFCILYGTEVRDPVLYPVQKWGVRSLSCTVKCGDISVVYRSEGPVLQFCTCTEIRLSYVYLVFKYGLFYNCTQVQAQLFSLYYTVVPVYFGQKASC